MAFEVDCGQFIDDKNVLSTTSSSDHLIKRTVNLPAVGAKDTTLIIKFSDSKLDHLNDFVMEQIVTIYQFDKNIGW